MTTASSISSVAELLSSWDITSVISSFFCVNSLMSLSTSACKVKDIQKTKTIILQ